MKNSRSSSAPQRQINATCRSCGAPIEWVQTPSAKAMPVDAEAVEDGNILLCHRQLNEPAVAFVQTKEQIQQARDEAERTGQPHRLFKSHFATCPQARKWRK